MALLQGVAPTRPPAKPDSRREPGAAATLWYKTDYRLCQLRGRLRRGIANRPSGLWIRHSVRIVGDVHLGDRVRLREHVLLDAGEGRLRIGSGTYIGQRSEIYAQESIQIGDDSLIAMDVLIMDTDHHVIEGNDRTRPVTIGSHVWIGARASVLKGVTIGDGAVIAAAAVVTSDVAPGYLAAGVPARAVRPVTWRA